MEGLEARLTVGEYLITGGFGMKCILDSSSGSDWAKVTMTEELQDFLKDKNTDECRLELGNSQSCEILISGRGRITSENVMVIYADEKARQKEGISVFFLDATFQEAVKYILMYYGIENYCLTEQRYGRKQNFKIDARSYTDAFLQLNAIYGTDVDFFNQNGTFYCGVQPDQEEYYVLTDDQILDMEQTGNVWRAEIIPIPGLTARKLVRIECEEYTGMAYVQKCIAESEGANIDMWIEFREKNDG